VPVTKSLLVSFAVLAAPLIAWADGPPHSWSKRFGDANPQQGWSVATDAFGNVVLAGQFEGTINLGGGVLTSIGGNDIFLAKFDASGNHLWSHGFTDPNYDNSPSVAVDASGNVIMSGNFSGSIDFGGDPLNATGADVDIFLVKFDPDGNHVWSYSFGDASTELSGSVAVDASGNIVWTGYFFQTVNFGGDVLTSTSVFDMYLVKFGPNGNHIWSESYGLTGSELSTHLKVDASGNVVVGGRFNGTVNFGGGVLTAAGGVDIYLVKFGSGGNHLWSHRFGDANTQLVGGLAFDTQGNVILSGGFMGGVNFGGSLLTSAGNYDVFIAKFESDGDHLWSYRFGDADVQTARDVSADAAGNVVMAGSFEGTINFGGGALTASGSDFSDIFLVGFDSGGIHDWSEKFGDGALDYPGTMTLDRFGAVLLSGRFQGTINFGGSGLTSLGDDDVFLVKFASTATGIAGIPTQGIELHAYPNPFNPTTTLAYYIPRSGFTKLEIYDASGRLVKALVKAHETMGDHTATWEGRDEEGTGVASGVYFARLAFEGTLSTQKIVLLK
jgi:FlgD Ig-like domain